MSEVFRIIIEDDYRAGKGFEMIIQQTAAVKVQMEGVAVAGQRMAVAGEDSFNKMARSGLRLVSLFAIMDMAFMRVSVAHSILEGTQERYDEAVKEHGATSSQAIKAGRELERVQNYVSRSHIRAGVSVLSYGVNLAITTGLLKANTVASAANALKTRASAAAIWLENHARAVQLGLLGLGVVAVAAYAVGLGLAADQAKRFNEEAERVQAPAPTIGGMPLRTPTTFGGIALGGVTINVSGEDEDFDEQWRETGAMIKSEYRRRSP